MKNILKGINAITTANDPGQDGFAGVNNTFAKDISAFSLEYFNGDYVAINGATPLASVNTSSHAATNSSQLFNGNIRYMQTRLTNPNTKADMPMLNAYKYDQLNRLKESRSYETGLTSNVWNPTTYGNAYYNAFSYDAMGNIENQIRHDRNGDTIDNLTYHYQKSGGKLVKNRLYHLNDAQTNASAFTDDIDNMLTFRSDVNRLNTNNNYNYDEEGRLVKDSSERISKIVWRVDGKVKEIQRNGGSAKWLRFDYDAMGNRIAKHVFANNGSTHEKSTYYVLDAQGNQISTYDYEVVGGSAKFHLKERNIFGSSRIGSKQDSLNVLTATLTQNYTQVLGNKYYEFSNHLGNVLTVFSDVKISLDANSNGVVDGFRVPIRNIADYSPFGVQLDGRTISMDSYRYGFQNQEKDDEIKGAGNSVNYTYRMHDPRVGRFFAVDPLIKSYPFYSSYSFSGNRVLDSKEIEGLEPENIHYYNMVKQKDGSYKPKDKPEYSSEWLTLKSENSFLKNNNTGQYKTLDGGGVFGPQTANVNVYTYWENGEISKQVAVSSNNQLDGSEFVNWKNPELSTQDIALGVTSIISATSEGIANKVVKSRYGYQSGKISPTSKRVYNKQTAKNVISGIKGFSAALTVFQYYNTNEQENKGEISEARANYNNANTTIGIGFPFAGLAISIGDYYGQKYAPELKESMEKGIIHDVLETVDKTLDDNK